MCRASLAAVDDLQRAVSRVEVDEEVVAHLLDLLERLGLAERSADDEQLLPARQRAGPARCRQVMGGASGGLSAAHAQQRRT